MTTPSKYEIQRARICHYGENSWIKHSMSLEWDYWIIFYTLIVDSTVVTAAFSDPEARISLTSASKQSMLLAPQHRWYWVKDDSARTVTCGRKAVGRSIVYRRRHVGIYRHHPSVQKAAKDQITKDRVDVSINNLLTPRGSRNPSCTVFTTASCDLSRRKTIQIARWSNRRFPWKLLN